MRIILLIVQIAVGLFATKYVVSAIPGIPGNLYIFAFAIVAAILIFLVGLLASALMRDIGSPTSGTLVFSIVLALVGAGLTLIGPVMGAINTTPVPSILNSIGTSTVIALPVLGAVIGYLVKR